VKMQDMKMTDQIALRSLTHRHFRELFEKYNKLRIQLFFTKVAT